jgi:hypothetical protein
MVKVKCPKHGEHLLKPTDVAVLLEQYVIQISNLAFHEPLPEIDGISTPEALYRAFCPQKDVDDLKIGRAKVLQDVAQDRATL